VKEILSFDQYHLILEAQNCMNASGTAKEGSEVFDSKFRGFGID
jgi:hypothetical protein